MIAIILVDIQRTYMLRSVVCHTHMTQNVSFYGMDTNLVDRERAEFGDHKRKID